MRLSMLEGEEVYANFYDFIMILCQLGLLIKHGSKHCNNSSHDLSLEEK